MYCKILYFIIYKCLTDRDIMIASKNLALTSLRKRDTDVENTLIEIDDGAMQFDFHFQYQVISAKTKFSFTKITNHFLVYKHTE